MKKLIIICMLASLVACEKDCQDDPANRKGAVCNDGSKTNATGSGACSGHGGVDHWICK